MQSITCHRRKCVTRKALHVSSLLVQSNAEPSQDRSFLSRQRRSRHNHVGENNLLIAYLRLQALLTGAEKRVEALRQDVNILKQEREKLDVRPHAL
jgi:hypothetical protein